MSGTAGNPRPSGRGGRQLSSVREGEFQASGIRPQIPDLDASTDDFARALGIDPDSFGRHSALGDCRLVAAMLDVIEGRS